MAIGIEPGLLGLGDIQFDKALGLRKKAPRNGRTLAYCHALAELKRAIETYSHAGSRSPPPLEHLGPLLRKLRRKKAKK
ncbi:hypothetical protein G3V96_29000 [Escherichia coli]|nr:hypothetical protein [Escherichia coli]